MKALAIDKFGGIEETHWEELPVPPPKSDEVQIQIAYAAVNPVDWKICEGYLQKLLPHAFPLIPGWDASGTISAVGANVTSFKEGDEVYAYCRKPTVQWGTYAEYVCFESKHVAHKPQSLSLAQAAAIPLVGLTAWQSLFEAANLKQGQSILIHAGAGGVGSLAVQFAKYAGATVYTTASNSNHDYVKSLGADVAIDYHNEFFVDAVKRYEPRGVDVVFDCVGFETLENSYLAVKPKGVLVSIVNRPDQEKCEEYRIRGEFVFVRPDGATLETIGQLINEGDVRPPTITEMPFDEYAKAWDQIKSHHTQGKIVLKIGKSN
jgi:NADPH:quinone reductase-like Zn-dependent oxidoreductase